MDIVVAGHWLFCQTFAHLGKMCTVTIHKSHDYISNHSYKVLFPMIMGVLDFSGFDIPNGDKIYCQYTYRQCCSTE